MNKFFKKSPKSNSPKSKKTIFTKKTFAFLAGFVGIGLTPLVTLAAKNNNPFNTSYFKEMNLSDVQNNTKYENLKKVETSYGALIRGTKTYNNGNYVLYFGSEACRYCTSFLYGDSNYATTGVPNLSNTINGASWKNGVWGQGIEFADKEKEKLNVKFVVFEDFVPWSEEFKNDDKWALPWSKWDQNKFENGQIANNYKRYDESAIQLREILDFAKSIYPDVKGTPTVISFKNGIPDDKPYVLEPAQDGQNPGKEGEAGDKKGETPTSQDPNKPVDPTKQPVAPNPSNPGGAIPSNPAAPNSPNGSNPNQNNPVNIGRSSLRNFESNLVASKSSKTLYAAPLDQVTGFQAYLKTRYFLD